MKFADIGLSDELLRAIDESGYDEATPIQAGVIPSAAVFASAIEDAEGFPITSMPISPSELFALRLHHEQKLQEGPHA